MEPTTLHLHTGFSLGPVDDRVFGGFLEHMGRAVYGGIFEPSNERADEFGCRRDVCDNLKQLGLTTVRYPGGNFVSGYHWRDGVGATESRPRLRSLPWRSIEPNTFGTCEFVTAEPDLGRPHRDSRGSRRCPRRPRQTTDPSARHRARASGIAPGRCEPTGVGVDTTHPARRIGRQVATNRRRAGGHRRFRRPIPPPEFTSARPHPAALAYSSRRPDRRRPGGCR